MEEVKKERWLTYMAITTILIAVAATLSTFKGGGFSTRSLLNQTKASDIDNPRRGIDCKT